MTTRLPRMGFLFGYLHMASTPIREPVTCHPRMAMTVRTVCMVCMVLSRCFYARLAFACGNETHHGGRDSNSVSGDGNRNGNRAGAKKVVKAPNGGHHGAHHKGGL